MKKNKWLLIGIVVLMAIGTYFLVFYNEDGQTSDGGEATSGMAADSMDAVDREMQERSRQAQREQDSPAQFLQVTIDPKKNLFGESVIEGNIQNKAQTTTYSEFAFMLYWQDEAGMVMDSAEEVVFETIHPGESVDFKTKRKGPRKSKSIQVKLRSAQAATK